MLAALLYTVHALLLPPHSAAVLSPASGQAQPVLYRRPSTVALDSNGVAVIVRVTEEDARVSNPNWWTRSSPDRVVIEDDRTHVLPFPTASTLAPFFTNPNATNLMSISNLVLSGGGKPVIALYAEVGGAYWAVQEASFVWSGSNWTPPIHYSSGRMPKNVWVAAADSRGGLGYVGDYLYLDPAKLVNPRADNLFDVAMIDRAQHVMVLGRGIITAMDEKRTVGYDDGYVPGSNGSTPVQAIEWTGYHRSVLGTGVAWSVNARGDVVGDNRKTLKSAGVPTIWHNGTHIRLSNAEGTAFAISDDGTIVGEVKSGAFLIRPNDPARRLTMLDDVVGGEWHIIAAYYIAHNGDVLALASRVGSPPRLVLLRPRAR